jgi:hypothetical protein
LSISIFHINYKIRLDHQLFSADCYAYFRKVAIADYKNNRNWLDVMNVEISCHYTDYSLVTESRVSDFFPELQPEQYNQEVEF